jgi:7-cyano-7-deazaguanine synthase
MKSALVLLSGGLDSATVLGIASKTFHCTAISFDYGQRHVAELQAARNIAARFGVSTHTIITLNPKLFQNSALTDPNIAVPTSPTTGIPSTYVPARNTLFLSYALVLAESHAIQDIFIGVNAVDYSGYPDCRPEYIHAFSTMANLATKSAIEGQHLTIHTPLIDLSKAEIIQQGIAHGVDYGLTVSCYAADSEGRACGVCDSCRLRREGFIAAGVADPTRYGST